MWKKGNVMVMAIAILVACQKAEKPSAVFNRINKAVEAKDVEALKSCYTQKTLEIAAKISEISPEKKPWLEQMIEKGPQPEPEIIGEESKGDSATVTIKIGDKQQPVKVVKEEGVWKIDMSKEMEMALQFMERMKKMQEEAQKETEEKK